MTDEKSTAKERSAERDAEKTKAECLGFPPASDIPVCTFREILLWPFVLTEDDPKEGFEPAARMCDIARAIERERDWESVSDLVDHVQSDPGESFGGEGRDHPQSWAEIVYFHDFVQRALFRKTRGEWPDADAPIWLLRNRRLKGLKTDIKGRQLNFAVDRLNLYLFPTGVAILALEVALEGTHDDEGKLVNATLADIQNFMDYFRRWHIPFWNNMTKPGLLPERVSWIWEGNECPVPFEAGVPDFHGAHRHMLSSKVRTPHPLPHWLEVLPNILRKNLAPALEDNRPASTGVMSNLYWRTISDERMITTNFITVPENCYRRIRKSDWVRLCFADAAGGKSWPYCIYDCDWRRFHAEHVFDWFYDKSVRQLFAGFNHTMVCASSNFSENTLVHHFRRHYFQMALLAQFEFTALLSFSSRITRAVEALRKGSDETHFRDRFIKLRRDFLHFVHEFRFTGVSNQMQARAMYGMWRKHLGLNELFHDVEDELRSGSDYLLAIENREQTETALQQAKTSLRQAEISGRLNLIATIGVALGLGVAFAATKGFDYLRNKITFIKSDWFVAFGLLNIMLLVIALVIAYFLLRDDKPALRRTSFTLCALIVPFVVLTLVAWYL